jgi:inosine-uridine nucleoside N-ribohydrolase
VSALVRENISSHLDQATRNGLTVVELSGRQIPVYQEAAQPLRIKLEPPPDFVHDRSNSTGLR